MSISCCAALIRSRPVTYISTDWFWAARHISRANCAEITKN